MQILHHYIFVALEHLRVGWLPMYAKCTPSSIITSKLLLALYLLVVPGDAIWSLGKEG